MPTPYTADPTATQAPAAPPYDDVALVVNLPIDTDPPNAATWAQAYKALADYVQFLKAPFGNSADVGQAIARYRNALLQARGVVDHLGYNDLGQVLQVNEDWNDVGMVLKNSIANGAWSGRWNYSISGAAAGRVELSDPAPFAFLTSIFYPRTSCLLLSTGTGGITANSESVEHAYGLLADDDADLVMQWGFMSQGTASGLNSAQGFTAVSQQGVTTEFVTQDVQGVALVCRPGHANFELYTKGGTGSSHIDDTGIAKDDGKHRVRLELRGANANDSGVARVRLFLDAAPGAAPVVDRAILIAPPAGGSAVPVKPMFRTTATNVVTKLAVARLQIRNNTETGNAIY
jgi:hypothetical protein